MKELKDRIADISTYLNRLTKKEVYSEVQTAVVQQDKEALVGICRKVKVPDIYVGSVISLLLSIAPQQKWPGDF
jgi:hypothetical protein